MSTKMKLMGMVGIVSLVTICLAVYSYFGLTKVTDMAEALYAKDLLGVDLVNQIQTDIMFIARDEKNTILADKQEDIAMFESLLRKNKQELERDRREAKKYFYTEHGHELLRKLDDAILAWLATHDHIVSLTKFGDPEKTEEARVLSFTKGREQARMAIDLSNEVIDLKRKFADAQNQAIADTSANLKLISIIATLSGIIIGMSIGWVISTKIVRQLGDEPESLAKVAQRISEGDLTVQFDPHKPEIGVFGAMKHMVKNLTAKIAEAEQKGREAQAESQKAREATTEAEQARKEAESAMSDGMMQAAHSLEEVVEVATSASGELSSQISRAHHGATEQTNQVTGVATAMEEMNATILEVARNATHAASTSDGARQKAQEGEVVVGKVMQGIEDVRKHAGELKVDMGTLGRQAEGIGKVIEVISDIADQTNLLALNAAIEAARAGDAGRGFAVVADEVRKLAEKTMTATKEVEDAIHTIQAGAKKNMDGVDRAAKTIEETTHLASQSGTALKEIVHLAAQVSDQVHSIATASEEQSATSEEINRSVEQVATISGETTQAMHQANLAVTEVAKQTQVLKSLIDDLKRA